MLYARCKQVKVEDDINGSSSYLLSCKVDGDAVGLKRQVLKCTLCSSGSRQPGGCHSSRPLLATTIRVHCSAGFAVKCWGSATHSLRLSHPCRDLRTTSWTAQGSLMPQHGLHRVLVLPPPNKRSRVRWARWELDATRDQHSACKALAACVGTMFRNAIDQLVPA